MKIEDEIQQKKFPNEAIKADINIMFTASFLGKLKSDHLKPFGITWQQFNILRILRGQKPNPVTVKTLAERMIDKMSNASRLVDKLIDKNYAERFTCPADRRKVDILITGEGLDIIGKASNALELGMETQFKNLTKDELVLLSALLDKLRN